jgi:hypothetical protein
MRSHRVRFAFASLVALLLAGAGAPTPEAQPSRPMRIESAVQPFLITFDRHEVQVIAFLTNHPEYEAIELMVTRRAGQPPLLRAIITQHDGVQIDFFNDAEVARERAAVLTDRQTLYQPFMRYEEGQSHGLPAMRLRFISHRGEEIVLSYEAFSPPTPELGGFINPGEHSGGASLPVMWATVSAHASPRSRVTVDGVPYRIAPSPLPGALLIIYSEDFLIGVIREGSLRLWLAWSPRRLAVGEKWLYWDHLQNLHEYEIIGIDGGLLTLHKTTTSAFLPEEILTAQFVDGRLLLRSVRATGRLGRQENVPPAPEGFTLDLSVDGRFSLSIDAHENLVTGTASREVRGSQTTWTLQPLEPSWTRIRTVRASVSRFGPWYLIENTVGGED